MYNRGETLYDWLPIRNVRTLTAQIRTPEVRVATFLKKHLFLNPAIKALRKKTTRDHESSQVDEMR